MGLMIILRQGLLVFAQHLNALLFNRLVDNQWQGFVYVNISIIVVWGIITMLDKIRQVYEVKVTQDMGIKIREDVSLKMTSTSYQNYHHKTKGQYLSWLNNDIDNILTNGFLQYCALLRGISGVIFAGYALIYYNWSLLVTTLFGFILILYIPKLFDKKIYTIGKEVTQANETFVSEIEENLNGYATFFAYNGLHTFISRIRNASYQLKDILMKQAHFRSNIMAINFSINVIFQVILTMLAGIGYFKGNNELGAVAAVGSLADIIFSGLGQVSSQIAAIRGVKPIFDKFNTLSPETIQPFSPQPNSIIYQLNNVTLTYGEQLIFKNLSLDIEKNKKYLLMGRSGSGKSSLYNLLLGYNQNYQGTITFLGEDLQNISSKQIAQHVLHLSQTPYIFTGTVRENLTLGENFPEEELLHALQQVGFYDASQWLERTVGFQGDALSGGQKQRLALARALIRKPTVVLLDEITSALDKDSIIEIEKLLLSLENVTLMIITHSFHEDSMKLVDTVYDLDMLNGINS